MKAKTWSDDMGEISGFGGGYEAVCRALVLAGIAWVDAHPDANPAPSSVKNVFGLVLSQDEDTKLLERAMLAAPVYHEGKLLQEKAGDDCTGAMLHAAFNHVMAYKRLGWEQYCAELRARDD